MDRDDEERAYEAEIENSLAFEDLSVRLLSYWIMQDRSPSFSHEEVLVSSPQTFPDTLMMNFAFEDGYFYDLMKAVIARTLLDTNTPIDNKFRLFAAHLIMEKRPRKNYLVRNYLIISCLSYYEGFLDLNPTRNVATDSKNCGCDRLSGKLAAHGLEISYSTLATVWANRHNILNKLGIKWGKSVME